MEFFPILIWLRCWNVFLHGRFTRKYNDNFILSEEKYTQGSYIADVESEVLVFLYFGLLRKFRCAIWRNRLDGFNLSGTGPSKDQFNQAVISVYRYLERMVKNGATVVIDGPGTYLLLMILRNFLKRRQRWLPCAQLGQYMTSSTTFLWILCTGCWYGTIHSPTERSNREYKGRYYSGCQFRYCWSEF